MDAHETVRAIDLTKINEPYRDAIAEWIASLFPDPSVVSLDIDQGVWRMGLDEMIILCRKIEDSEYHVQQLTVAGQRVLFKQSVLRDQGIIAVSLTLL